jgi:citrate synthase
LTDQRRSFVSSREAARRLGIKLATLYAYASRGLVESVSSPNARGRRYSVADLDRLKARHDARSGHGPVAAAALSWGEPVLESAITAITSNGPCYRGQPAVDLARAGVGFESVAELLWNGVLPERLPRWRVGGLAVSARGLRTLLPRDATPLSTLMLVVSALALADDGRFDAPRESELVRARALLRSMAASLALLGRGSVQAALRAPSMAESVAIALGAGEVERAAPAIDLALLLSADHELNVSAFAARVTASAGADLYACTAAALAALSGARHGGMCDRIEAMIDEVEQPQAALPVLRERLRRGDSVPGISHPLYPDGDPRAPPLLLAARRLAKDERPIAALFAVVESLKALGHAPPTLDMGLVAVALALGLPRGSAAALFALGRSAGWIAHVLEQRALGQLLRPRARYVGPTPVV